MHENVDTEQFREKLLLAVLITPYGPVKTNGLTAYISTHTKKKMKLVISIPFFFFFFFLILFLIRFEPEQKVTVSFLY